MNINLEVVASLADFLARDRGLTIANLVGLLHLAESRHPDAIASAIDKGITIDELTLGVSLAVMTRILDPPPAFRVIGGDGGSLASAREGHGNG